MSHDDWVTVAQYTDPMAAGIAARLLTSLDIPNRVSAWPRSFQRDIWVPPEFVSEAKRALEQGTVPEQDLTKLALSYPPPDDAVLDSQMDDTNSATSDRSDGRRIPFLTPFLGVLALLLDTLFVSALGDFRTRGDHIICPAGGCRSFGVTLALLGLCAAVVSLAFVGSLANRK